MTFRRLRPLFLWVMLSAVLLSGCWDIREINHRALPVIMGISKIKNKESCYKIYLKIPIPAKPGSFNVIATEGPSISKAISILNSNMDRDLDMLHLKLIAIDEDYARESINDLLTFAMRTRDISAKALIAVVQGDLEDFLYSGTRAGENIGASYNFFFSKNVGWTPRIAKMYLWQAYQHSISELQDAAVPILQKSEHTMFSLEGTALLSKDKMVSTIEPKETLMYNFFLGNFQGGVVETVRSGSVLVQSVDVINHPRLEAGKPVLDSRMRLKVSAMELHNGISDREIADSVEQSLTKRFEHFMKTMQKHHADVLGIGTLYQALLPPRDLNRWRTEIFPELKVNMKIEVDVVSHGFVK